MRLSMHIGPAVATCLLAVLCNPIAFAQDDETCLACHGDIEEQHLESMHGSMGFTCVDCHSDLYGLEDYPHDDSLQTVDCGMCHGEVQELYVTSRHGYALERGDTQAPTCAGCH